MPTTIPKRQFLRYIALGVACLSHTTFAEPTVSVATEIHAQPQTPEDLRKAAMEAGKAKNWPQSLEAWGRYLQMRPEDEKAWGEQGYVLLELERYEEAIASYRRATELKPDSDMAWNGLCWTQILAGQFSAARFSCERDSAIRPNSMAATVNLGHTWLLTGDAETAQGWYDKALPLIDDENDLKDGPLADFDIFIERGWQVEASQKARAWFAEKGPAWLASKAPADTLFKQAQAAEKSGDKARAITLYQERLPLLEVLYGAESHRVILAADKLGDLLAAAGRHAEALPLYQRVLAYREKRSESESETLAVILNDMATTLTALKRPEDALTYKQRALAVAERALGAEDSKTVNLADQLADQYAAAGRHTEALPLYQRVLAWREKQPIGDGKRLILAINNVAIVLKAQKQNPDAITYKLRAQELSERMLGTAHRWTIDLANQLADQYAAAGRHAEALPLYQRALGWREKQPESEANRLIDTLNDVAKTLTALKRPEEALTYKQRALAVADRTWGAEDSKTVNLADQLADQYAAAGRHTEALPLYQRALGWREKQPESEANWLAKTLNEMAQTLTALKRPEEALTYKQRAFTVAERAWGTEDSKTVIIADQLANLYIESKRYSDALSLLNRMLSWKKMIVVFYDPKIYERLARVSRYMNDDAKARKYDEMEVVYDAMYRQCNEFSPFGRQSTSNEEIKYCIEALYLLEKHVGTTHVDVAKLLNKIAKMLVTSGRVNDALPYARRAVSIMDITTPGDFNLAGLLSNLGTLESINNNFIDAERHFRRAVALVDEIPEALEIDSEKSAIYQLMASYLMSTGRYAEAKEYAKNALDMKRRYLGSKSEIDAELISATVVFGELLVLLNDHNEAMNLFLDILARYDGKIEKNKSKGTNAGVILNMFTTGMERDLIPVLHILAGLYLREGLFDEAIAALRRALDIGERRLDGQQPLHVITLSNLSILLYPGLEADRLLGRAWQAVAQAQSPTLAFSLNVNLMAMYGTSIFHQKELAIWHGKQAINTVQQMRGGLKVLEKEAQQNVLKSVEFLYQFVADLLIDQNRFAEAQQVLAMLKEDEYYQFLERSAVDDPRSTQASYAGVEVAINAELQAHTARLLPLYAELAELENQAKDGLSDAQKARREALGPLLVEAREAFEAYVASLPERLAKASGDRMQDVVENADSTRAMLQELSTKTGENVALLQYVLSKERVTVLVTTPDSQFAQAVSLDKGFAGSVIKDFLPLLTRPSVDPRPQAKDLYAKLIGPIREQLDKEGIKTLMFSPDGVLRYLPFAALHDGERYLIESFRLAYFNPVVDQKNVMSQNVVQWTVGGLGLTEAVTKDGFTFSPLPTVQAELDGITAILPGEKHLNAKFNKTQMLDILGKGYPVIHIASHFVFDPAGLNSYLLLGDQSALTLREVKSPTFKFGNVDLLTLSACETGKGGDGKEVEGFGTLAQKKGAKGVMATLWKVSDVGTGTLMQNFYRLREEQKLTKAEALRQAQLALLNGKVGAGKVADLERGARRADGQQAVAFVPDPKAPFAHPYYWAPFILMGNWL